MNQNDIGYFLRLFELNFGCTAEEVKSTYRTLAKKNHPDMFTDDDNKEIQEKKMAHITEVFNTIMSNIDLVELKEVPSTDTPSDQMNTVENDYTIYKSGLLYFNLYFGMFKQIFSQRPLKTTAEKLNCLEMAKSQFKKLIHLFPESDWSYDCNDRIYKIEKAMNMIRADDDDL